MSGEDMTVLTSKSQEIAHATWPAVDEHWLEILTKTFERWFNVHTELKTVFYNTPDDVSIEQAVRSDIIIQHIEKVRKVMVGVVKNIMNPDKLSTTVQSLGKRHANYGGQTKYAPVFLESFMSSVADIMKVNDEIVHAWKNVLVFILHHFAVGLEKGISEAR